MYETYETLESDCNLCEKKAEILYIHDGLFGIKIRKFCKKCAKLHRVVKKD